MKVTCVIPANREKSLIKEVIKNAKSYCDDILVVVAKKSDDSTYEIAKSTGVRVIRDNGKGKGDGIRCAIEDTKDKRILVFIDADGSHIYQDITKVVKPIKEGKAEMVIASRLQGGSMELYDGSWSSYFRTFFTITINQIINARFKSHITDSQNGFRAIRSDIARKLDLKSDVFDIETEEVMKMLKRGYKIAEVPSMELSRSKGKSGVSLRRHGLKYLWRVIVNFF